MNVHPTRCAKARARLRHAAVPLVLLMLLATPARASEVWSSNAQSRNLHPWNAVQCGAPSASYCPAGCDEYVTSAQGGFRCRGDETPSPLTTCPAGTDCRLRFEQRDFSDGPKDYLRIQVNNGDKMWSGDRSELIWNAECDQTTGVCENLEGQERFYVWSVALDSTFPRPPASGGYWHTLFQFHEVGECATNGAQFAIGLDKYDADRWVFDMGGKTAYPDCGGVTEWWRSAPITLNRKYNFILHVKWSKSASIGFYRLYLDGALVRTVSAATLFTWPQTGGGCGSTTCDAAFHQRTAGLGGKAMSVNLKSGIYHAQNSALEREVAYFSTLAAVTTCAEAGVPGCGSTCTPTTCAAQGATCGSIPDGCGGTLQCGGCASGSTCGGGGTPNVCGGGSGKVGVGDATWVRQLGTSGDEYAYGSAVLPDGSVVVAGYTTGTLGQASAGSGDVFLQRYLPGGATVWSKPVQLGTSGNERVFGLAADPSGNIFVVGQTTGAFTAFHGGAVDGFVAKIASSGALAWAINVGTAGDDVLYGAATDDTGHVFVAGSTTGAFNGGPFGARDVLLARFTPLGSLSWKQQLGNAGDQVAYGIAVDDANWVAIPVGVSTAPLGSGTFKGGTTDGWWAEFDKTRGTRYSVIDSGTSGDDEANAVAVDDQGHVYVAGSTTGSWWAGANRGGVDGWVAKWVVATGAGLWMQHVGGGGNDWLYGIAARGTGETLVVGTTTGTLGAQSAGGYDFLTAQLSTTGGIGTIRQLGTAQDEVARAAAADNQGGLYAAGGTLGELGGSHAGGKDAVLVKYGGTAETSWEAGAFRQLPRMRGGLEAHVSTLVHANDGAYAPFDATRAARYETMLAGVFDAIDQTRGGGSPDWCGVADMAAQAGYVVRRFFDEASSQWLVYAADPAGHHAHVFINPMARRDLVVEAPHAGFETNTSLQAARILIGAGARVLLINGADRCSLNVDAQCSGEATTTVCGGTDVYRESDVPHAQMNAFHLTHRFLENRARTTGGVTRFVQLHGMAGTATDKLEAADGSSDVDNPASPSVAFVSALRSLNHDLVYSCQDASAPPPRGLCATRNVQGRYTNGSPDACSTSTAQSSGRFLHLEQDMDYRDDDADGRSWTDIQQALIATWPECSLGSCSVPPAAQQDLADLSCP